MIEAGAPVNYDALDALRSVLGFDFPDLIRKFRIQMADGLVCLELALARKDNAKIKAIAHMLKGSALSLHCKPLADCCARVERSADLHDTPALEVLLEELRDLVLDTVSAIEWWAE